MFLKSLLGAVAAGGLIFAAGAANATVATYTTASAYNAFGGGGSIGISDPVDWGQFSTAQGNSTINNSTVRNGATMATSNGENVTATNAGSTPFTVYTNGATGGLAGTRWDGDFGNGTSVLYTSGTSITLSFNGAITGFGIDAQTSLAGAYGFTIQAYNASNQLVGTASSSGTSTGRASNSFNTAAFAGLTSTAGALVVDGAGRVTRKHHLAARRKSGVGYVARRGDEAAVGGDLAAGAHQHTGLIDDIDRARRFQRPGDRAHVGAGDAVERRTMAVIDGDRIALADREALPIDDTELGGLVDGQVVAALGDGALAAHEMAPGRQSAAAGQRGPAAGEAGKCEQSE